jgi:hypothetical protein
MFSCQDPNQEVLKIFENWSGGEQKRGRILKGDRWPYSLLVQSENAVSHSKRTYAAVFYHRVARLQGKMRAIVAAGHHPTRAIYHVLKEGKSYHDLGPNYFDRRNEDTLKAHLMLDSRIWATESTSHRNPLWQKS